MQRLGLIALASLASVSASQAAPLKFDPKAYQTVHISMDGRPMELRRYHVVYVEKPTEVDLSRAQSGPPGGPRPPSDAGSAPRPPSGDGPPGSNATTPLNGRPMGFPAPTDPLAYQSMYIYVPAQSYQDGKAAIILQVNNGGWMASPARDIVREGAQFSSTSDTDNTGAALKAGYVVVSAGTRSRGIRSKSGEWVGKAPAVIVDAKAAVRYLRLNDALMPGSAERIVITGGSGGGGLSLAVAASGNSADYAPYLAEIGAAGIDAEGRSSLRDDVFATIAYCPINDLGNADSAYEWQYKDVRTATNTSGGFGKQAQDASSSLAETFPAVLEGLRLKALDGAPLNTARLQETIIALVRQGVEAAIARGERIPALGEDFVITQHMGPPPWTQSSTRRFRNEWLTVEGGQVKSIDYGKYLKFVAGITPLKGVPAFDSTASTGNQGVRGENSLFGSRHVEYSNFTAYAWQHNEVKGDGSGPDDTGLDWQAYLQGPGAELARQIKLSSPLPYLGGKATPAAYWYVRHGLIDRDTSFASQAILYLAAKNDPAIKQLDFKLAWLQGHAGNYDVQEAYAWLAGVLKTAGEGQTRQK